MKTKKRLSNNQHMRINTMLMDRLALGQGTTHGGARDLYDVFGYKGTLGVKDFRFAYDRGDLANRIVTAYPDAVWAHPPSIKEDVNAEEETAFEKAFAVIADESNLWSYVHRADILSQMGQYAVLFFGVSDGQEDLTQPAGKGKVAYLMPFGEDTAVIKETEMNVTNPRYGKPTLYELTIKAANGATEPLMVHHSRCIHIAERTLDNDIYGASILQSIYNRLEDKEKVVGGGAEVWWLNSRGGMNLNVDKDGSMTPEAKTALEDEVQEYLHKLTRVIKTKGVDVKTLNQSVASPKDQFGVILDTISGATGIPKRILIGSERGELASSQDDENWNKRVEHRRKNHCEPSILDKIVGFLAEIGQVKPPATFGYSWPVLHETPGKDSAVIAKDKAAAIATYSNAPEADHLVTPKQFVEDILGMEYKEDELEKMMKDEEAEMEEAAALLDKQIAEEDAANPNQPKEEDVK